MKNAVTLSLSLRDRDESNRYFRGFVANMVAIREIYPGWDVVLHCDNTVDSFLAEQADTVVRWPLTADLSCGFWRFTTVGDPQYDAVIVRDVDSVVGCRERNAVHAWLESPFKIHTMHDHPGHRERIMAGMWGAKLAALPFDFPHLVRWWLTKKGPFAYGADEWFLRRFVWPYAETDGLNHHDYPKLWPGCTPFPDGPAKAGAFVGAII